MFAIQQPVYERIPVFDDKRGASINLNPALEIFSKVDCLVENIYLSRTIAGVTRGMHNRSPEQLQYMVCLDGTLIDIVSKQIDELRVQIESKILGASLNYNAVLIPPGWFHGFRAISDCTCLYFSNQKFRQVNERSREFTILEGEILAFEREIRIVNE